MTEIICEGCGATLRAEDNVATVTCPECGKVMRNPQYKPVLKRAEQPAAQARPILKPASAETPAQPKPLVRAEAKPLARAEAPAGDAPAVFRFRCKNCGAVITVTSDSERAVCEGCGKSYRNPKYVAPAAEPAQEEAQQPETPVETQPAVEAQPAVETQPAVEAQPAVETQPVQQVEAPAVFRFRCKNCGAVITVTSDSERAVCESCGKSYRNPKYVAPAVEPEQEEAQQPETQAAQDEQQPETQAETQPEQQTEAPATFRFRCKNCGDIISVTSEDEYATCANCGKSYRNPKYMPPAPSSVEEPSYEGEDEEQNYENVSYEEDYEEEQEEGGLVPGDTHFNGSGVKYFFMSLLNFLQNTFTLGLGTVWTKCRQLRWIFNHMTIDGKKLRFDGKGSEIFGKWFGWTLLTIITLGAYGFWKTQKMEEYYASRIHFEDGAPLGESRLNSSVETYVGTLALCGYTGLLTLALFGFGVVWAFNRYTRWYFNYKVVDGYKIVYECSSWRLFGKLLVYGLLTAVTFGIFSFFLPRKIMRYLTSKMHLEEA